MARRPERHRQRERNELAVMDGFAAGPVVRQDENRALQDNSAQAHMAAILNSGLTDEIDDDTAYERALAARITDNFGSELATYRRQLDGGFANARTEDTAERLEGPRAQFGGAVNRGGNLPAVARRDNAVGVYDPNAARGPQYMTEWLHLRRSGGYMLEQIRRLGRDIFAQYAPGTAIEDLNMIGYRRPGGPQGGPVFHSQEFVMDHIRWITQVGHEITTDTIDFGANIPGYTARASLWEVDHFNFLIVSDNHGEYAYGWPRPPRPQLAPTPNVPRLR